MRPRSARFLPRQIFCTAFQTPFVAQNTWCSRQRQSADRNISAIHHEPDTIFFTARGKDFCQELLSDSRVQILGFTKYKEMIRLSAKVLPVPQAQQDKWGDTIFSEQPCHSHVYHLTFDTTFRIINLVVIQGGDCMRERSNVTEQVVQYLKENITSGNWPVGEKIPSENQLTEALGISRASVRAAIQHLVGLGVLESQHGRGTFLVDNRVDENPVNAYRVTAEDCRDILKVLEFRRIVESEACRLATQYRTPELLEQLQQYLDKMVSSVQDSPAFVTADMDYHKAICKASQNPILEKSVVRVFEEMEKQQQQLHSIFGVRDGIYYHTLILNAMREGDADKAGQLMYEHLQSAIDRLQPS